LLDIVEKAGMHPVYSTYFNTFLMPVVLIVRLYNILTGKSRGDDLKTTPRFVNKLLTMIFSFEKYFIPKSSLPFGVSFLIIAKKNDEK